MQSVLEFEELDGTIAEANTETDPTKVKKARARIIVSIEESLYVHIQGHTTAIGVWTALKQLFDDKGLTRKITLLRHLITVRRDECNSMTEYILEISSTANKLIGIGFAITDEWIGAIMLAGLGEEYRPLILGLESSGVALTTDSIKTKLLDVDRSYQGESSSALLSYPKAGASGGKKSDKKKFGFKCYNCGKVGHKRSKCKSKPKAQSKNAKLTNAFMVNDRMVASTNWYLDSGASRHMTPHRNILQNFRPGNFDRQQPEVKGAW